MFAVRAKWRVHGFTLIELLVVIAIIGVMIGLLSSAVQKVRESANRAYCQNNLKHIGLATHNYLQAEKKFPPGCSMVVVQYYGHSWWTYLLPYLEQDNIFTRYDFTQHPERGNCYLNTFNRPLLSGKDFAFLHCPSSTLDRRRTSTMPSDYGGGTVTFAFADYAGITGSDTHPSVWTDAAASPQNKLSFGGMFNVVLVEGNGSPLQFGGDSGHTAHTNGMAIRIKHVTDGLSNTMMVGEQSGWCQDFSGNKFDCRANGASQSTTSDSSLQPFTMGSCCANWAGPSIRQLTTVRYPIGYRSSNGLGVFGPHTPIQSAHSVGAANVLMADGAVRYLTNEIPIATWKSLADRDDAGTIDVNILQ